MKICSDPISLPSRISTLLNSNRLNLAKTDIVTIDDQDTKERDAVKDCVDEAIVDG